jgi:hypothetical protein
MMLCWKSKVLHVILHHTDVLNVTQIEGMKEFCDKSNLQAYI